MSKTKDYFEDIIECQNKACEILLKYSPDVQVVHDAIRVAPNILPSITEEDRIKLEELGYYANQAIQEKQHG